MLGDRLLSVCKAAIVLPAVVCFGLLSGLCWSADGESGLGSAFSFQDFYRLIDNDTTNPRLFAPIPMGGNWTVQPGGKVELRFEHRMNRDMQHPPDAPAHDSPIFLYSFLNATIQNKDKSVTAFVEGSSINSSNYEPKWNPYEQVDIDVFQAWIEYKFPGTAWSMKVGRQAPPNLGDGRLMGPPAYWRNTVPDGITIRRETTKMDTTILAYSANTFVGTHDSGEKYASPLRPANAMIWGIYNTWKLPNKYEFDIYNLNKHSFNKQPYVSGSDGEDGRLQNYGFGSRIRGPLYSDPEVGTWAWGAEGMLQVGRYGGGNLLAHMLHADTSWEWACHDWKPKVTLFGNIASGNRDPGSNSYNRFDSLMGPSHYGYGLTDVVRLGNLNEVGLSFAVKPDKKTTIQTAVHQFWLNSAKDAWLSADQHVIAWDRNGDSGNSLGQEINILVTRKMNAHWTMQFGAAYLFTGSFGQNTNHGANNAIVYFDQTFTF